MYKQGYSWAPAVCLNGNSSSSSSDDGGCLVNVAEPRHKPGHGAFGRRNHHHKHVVANRRCFPGSTSRHPQAAQGRSLCPTEAEVALLHQNWVLQGQLGQLHWWYNCAEAELQRMRWLLDSEHAAHQAAQAELHQQHQLRAQAQAAQAAAEHACWEAEQGRTGCEVKLRKAEDTIHSLREEVKALQAAAAQQQAAATPAASLDWRPPAVKIETARWPGNAALQAENEQLKALVAKLEQAHETQTMVLQEEESGSFDPAAELATFKAKWASPEDGQSCDEEDDEEEEDVVAGLQAARLAAGQRSLLASDPLPAVMEGMDGASVLDSLFNSYNAFDRQAPAAVQQQAQPMVDALGSVQGPAEEEQENGFWDAPTMADSSSGGGGSDGDDGDDNSDLLSDLAAMQGMKQQALLAPVAAAAQTAAPAASPAPAAGGAAGGKLHDDLWYVEEAFVADNLKHMQQLRAFRSGLAARGLKF